MARWSEGGDDVDRSVAPADLDAFVALGAAWHGAPACETPAERAVLGIARDAIVHARTIARRTHASALIVGSPAGTITVERVAATPEGLVRFEGQLHSRALATALFAPGALSVSLVAKPVRDLRVSERDIGARILADLHEGVAARERAVQEADRLAERAERDARRARKAARREAKLTEKTAQKLARKAAKAAPHDQDSPEGKDR